MAQGQTLRDLMIDEIRDLYDAERQLVKALPKMAKGATSEDLRTLIETHLGETEQQVKRLEQAFEMLEEKPRGKRCEGMAGIIEEGSSLLEEDFDGAVLDAGIIAGAQRAEHYEITAYGSVMAWAKQLGEDDLAELLSESLEEEKAADQKLSALAEGTINSEAAQSDSEDAEMDEDEDEDSPRQTGTSKRAGGDMRMSAASGTRGSGSGSGSGSTSGRSSGKGGASGASGKRRS